MWAGTETQGVLRVRFRARPAPGEPRPACDVERFGKATGLPEGGITVVEVGHQPLFTIGTDDLHVERFDDAAGRFVREHGMRHGWQWAKHLGASEFGALRGEIEGLRRRRGHQCPSARHVS